MQDRILAALEERRSNDWLRELRPVMPGRAGHVLRGGRELLDCTSNVYLGLSRHSSLAERASEWAERFGTGARASRLVTGTLEAHCEIERKIARFKGTEAALLFASGWQANSAIFPALLKLAPETAVFADRLVHASIHHGIAAAQQRQIRFRHGDLDHLEELLDSHGKQPKRALL